MSLMPASLYVHVPFCSSRCSYCDFYSNTTNKDDLAAEASKWLFAIKRHQAALSGRFMIQGYRTIYFGGGSPSFLPKDVLKDAVIWAARLADPNNKQNTEFTVEANPEDIDLGLLDMLAEHGVNRLSVGVQSLENKARSLAGRRGTAKDTIKKLECISRNWPFLWSADFIAGLPGQSIDGLKNDISRLLDYGAGHISLYALTLDPDSPMAAAAASGLYGLADSDVQSEYLETVYEVLSKNSLMRYEVSNWARPRQESRHNMVYWTYGNWHGLGPSAVSNINQENGHTIRITNALGNDYYKNPATSASETSLDKRDAAFEFLMMALRTKRGLVFYEFEERYKIPVSQIFGSLEKQFPDLLHADEFALKPTDRGLDLLNIILLKAMENADSYYGKPR